MIHPQQSNTAVSIANLQRGRILKKRMIICSLTTVAEIKQEFLKIVRLIFTGYFLHI